MHLFRVTVPFNDNVGKSHLPAITRWENFLLKNFGGFTRSKTADGAWRNPDTDTVYNEAVIPYDIAVPNVWDADTIEKAFFRFFPDQLAVFIARIGSAHIRGRADVGLSDAKAYDVV